MNKRPALSNSERQLRFNERHNTIERRECKNPKLRKRLERDGNEVEWIRHYLAGAFPSKFGTFQIEIIRSAVMSVKFGIGTVVAAPRGGGKTTILIGVMIYLIARCIISFPVLGGCRDKDAKEIFRQMLNHLRTSKPLQDDYPELTQPFEVAQHPSRFPYLKWSDGAPCGAFIRTGDKIIILPDGMGAIAAGSLRGNIKGLNVALADGRILRPDALLVDDPQDVKRAGDPAYVADAIHSIESEWFCLAGPTKRIAPFVACTVKERNDVSEYFLKRPGFKHLRFKRIEAWPEKFNEAGSTCRALWDEWWQLYENTDTRAQSFKFYRKHKAEMTKGMRVSWPERMDKDRGDPDAMFAAMFDFYFLGERVFASEHQNDPITETTSVYTLTPQIIMSRTDPSREPYITPDWSVLRIGATDLNPSYGLTSQIKCYGKDTTSAIVWYGIFTEPPLPITENATRTQREAALYEALIRHGRQIAQSQARPEHWGVDAGGEYFDTVLRFCANSDRLCGIKATAMTGRAGKTYNENVKSRLGRPRNRTYECRDPAKGKWLCWDADHHKEAAQRAWLGSMGAPGSCSLFRGHHQEFAEQVCRERLGGKVEAFGRMVYEWRTQPGKHDYGDTNAMCDALAGWHGIGEVASGAVLERRHYTQSDYRRL